MLALLAWDGSFMNVNVLDEVPNLITEFGLRVCQRLVSNKDFPTMVPCALSMSMMYA